MDKKQRELIIELLDPDSDLAQDVHDVRDKLYLKGLITVNEMREFAGLEPILNGDQILVKAGDHAYHPLLDIDGCGCACSCGYEEEEEPEAPKKKK